MRLLLLLSYIALAAACSNPAHSARTKERDRTIVGHWLFTDFDFSQSYKIRGPDMTFTEYRFQVVELNKPAITLTLCGTWRVEGGKYCETYTSVSYQPWRTLVGRTHCADVTSQTPTDLYYFSRDNCPIHERRISKAEAAALAADRFAFITSEARENHRIEFHHDD